MLMRTATAISSGQAPRKLLCIAGAEVSGPVTGTSLRDFRMLGHVCF
jgi:hypothetical protein